MNPRKHKSLVCPRCHGGGRRNKRNINEAPCIACAGRGVIALSFYEKMLDAQRDAQRLAAHALRGGRR